MKHLVIALAILFSTQISAAEERGADIKKVNVAYAGFAMMGRGADLARMYPFSHPISRDINQTLVPKIRSITPDHYYLYADRKLDTDSGDTVALALALDHERISVEKIKDVYKVLINISAQVIIYDLAADENAVIAAYPVPIPSYIDIFRSEPTSTEVQALVRKFYLGGLNTQPIVDLFIALLKTIPVKQKYKKEIGIGNIFISEETLQSLPPQFAEDPRSFLNFAARQFGQRLVSYHNISLSPYQVDNTQAKLSLRFTGSEANTILKLPEQLDYYLDIEIAGLTMNEYAQDQDKKNRLGTSYLYGAFAGFQLRDGYEERILMRQYTKKGSIKAVPVSQTSVDHWAAVEANLISLFDEFARESPHPSRSWLREQEKKRDDQEQFKLLTEVLDQCR